MGGMVIGLVNQTKLIEITMLARRKIASKAASNICIGMGKKAQKIPAKNALETDLLLRCQREGCCIYLAIHLSEGFSLKLCSFGRYFLNSFRGIDAELNNTSVLYYAHELAYSQLYMYAFQDNK